MKVIAFDIDDVLCRRSGSEHLGKDKYKTCVPIQEGIDLCNKLHDDGYYIKLFTARGMSIFGGNVHLVYSELFDLTRQSLASWGVKYHELIMGKIHYDVLIDDKCLNSLSTDQASIEKFLNGH